MRERFSEIVALLRYNASGEISALFILTKLLFNILIVILARVIVLCCL
jgi:hypothetical protein